MATAWTRIRAFDFARLGPAAALALFGVAAFVLARYALRVHSFQPDEVIYVTEGRRLALDFPLGLFDQKLYTYGIERLIPFSVALTSVVFNSTGTAMQVEKVLIATA